MRQARSSGLKKRLPSTRPPHLSPVKAHVTHSTIAPQLSLPPTPFISSMSTFVAQRSPLLNPPSDLTPPSSNKRMRRNASPHFLLDDAFSSSHVLLSIRADQPPSPVACTSASPPPPFVVTDDVPVSSEPDKAVHIHHVLADTDVVPPQLPTTSHSPPSHPPSSTDPSVWTLAEIMERGWSQQWSEQDYKVNRPSGFTGLKSQSWARLDAAIRRRRHNHESETWELSFIRVCRNIRRIQDQKVGESSGDEESEQCADTDATQRGAAISSLVQQEIDRMEGEHRLLMSRFKEEYAALISKMTGELVMRH
jgi:hypothetical protein